MKSVEFGIVSEMHPYMVNEFVKQREAVEAWQKKFPQLEKHVTEYLDKLKKQLGIGLEILKEPEKITDPQAVKLFSLWQCSRRTDVSGYFKKLETRERLAKIAKGHSRSSSLSSTSAFNSLPDLGSTTSGSSFSSDSPSVKGKNVLMSEVIAKIAQEDSTFFNAKDIAELETLSSTESKMVVEKTQQQLSFMVEIIRRTGSIILNMRINSGPGGDKLQQLIDKFLNPFLESCGGAFTVKTVIPNCNDAQKKTYLMGKKFYGNKFGEVKEHTLYRVLKNRAMVLDMLASPVGTFVANSGSLGVLYQDSLLGNGVHFRKHSKDLLEFTPKDMKDGDCFAIAEILAPDTYVCQGKALGGIDWLHTDQLRYTSVVIMSGQKLKKQDELEDTLYVYLIGEKVTFSLDKIRNVDLLPWALQQWQELVKVEFKNVPLEGKITIIEPELIMKIQSIGAWRFDLMPAPTNPETRMPFVTMSNKDGSVIASNNRMACYAPLFVIGMFASSGSSGSSSSCSTASSSSSSMMDMTV